jgi:hypothetical protein
MRNSHAQGEYVIIILHCNASGCGQEPGSVGQGKATLSLARESGHAIANCGSIAIDEARCRSDAVECGRAAELRHEVAVGAVRGFGLAATARV